jgi:UDP-N-acetylglucosamine:LPS N-acetylglucosamine transferase
MRQRFLVLSASMGAGHDAVAHELARRLRLRGHTVALADVLALLPLGTGRALRGGYRATVRHAPRLYEAVYASFLARGPASGHGGGHGGGYGSGRGSAPLAALAERPLLSLAARWSPDAVVSTFHLSAQLTGRLRGRGALGVPAAVVVTDFAVHSGWLHPGNDLHLCVTEAAAHTAHAGTGADARATGPVVPPGFGDAAHTPGMARAWGERLERWAPGHRPAVLLSTGAWGVGSELMGTARQIARAGGLPVLLCGRDERLRRRASRAGLLALGWVTDMPGLMAASRALVDNAAGQTAVQALAAGVPVIGYRPLPGHGADGVRAMAEAGLSEEVATPGRLAAVVERLIRPGPVRGERVAAGLNAFGDGPVPHLEELARAVSPRSR